jgi:peptidoglycan/xylan/chitin deacetylase (PgdA/CDA1 family)
VALTFDDGYVDNLLAGLPRLAAAGVPATVFLATGYLDQPDPFWWDELASLMLSGTTPVAREIVVQDVSISFDFGTESPTFADRAFPVSLLEKRRAALEAIYQPLRRLREEEREPIMKELRADFAGPERAPSLGRAMTSEEVRRLVAGGLVTIGAHTVTHPILPELEPAVSHRELTASKLACEAITEGPVTAFAYPYGETSDEVRETVKTAGFALACSTRRGPAVTASEVFDLPRIYVPDLDGDAFEQRLQWASSLA